MIKKNLSFVLTQIFHYEVKMKNFIAKSKRFASFTLPLCVLAACGSDSSSGSDSKGIATKDDLPECTESLESEIREVEDTGVEYECKSGEWVEVDSSAAENSSSSMKGNSSSSGKGNSSSSGKVSSSSAKSESSSSAAEDKSSSSKEALAETFYRCEDHLHDISATAKNGTIYFESYGYTEAVPVGDEAELKSVEKEVQTNCQIGAINVKNASPEDFLELSPTLGSFMVADSINLSVLCDRPFTMGFGFEVKDTEKNREKIMNMVDELKWEGSFNTACAGSEISYCANSDLVNFYASYEYPSDSLVLEAIMHKFLGSTDSLDWLIRKLGAIREAFENKETAKAAKMMGVSVESPYVKLFEKGVNIYTQGANSSLIPVYFKVKGYENRELLDAVMDATCDSPENSWLQKMSIEAELALGKLCTDALDGAADSATSEGETKYWICEDNIWQKATAEDVKVGRLCSDALEDSLVFGYRCKDHEWKLGTVEERLVGAACTDSNAAKIGKFHYSEISIVFCTQYLNVEGETEASSKLTERAENGTLTEAYFNETCGYYQFICNSKGWMPCISSSEGSVETIGDVAYTCQNGEWVSDKK